MFILWLRASRLPMRNWNLSYGGDSRQEYCFQTTYEELKHPPQARWVLPDRASRLPMRNWNDSCSLWFRPLFVRFQTTYEELKLDKNVAAGTYYKLPDYLWGIETDNGRRSKHRPKSFQTTYEELKHGCCVMVSYLRSSFQTTYEELKRYIEGYTRGMLSSLPDYLWGIETGSSHSILYNWWGFQTTYEELKLRFSLCSGVSASRFQTTYEELKLPTYIWRLILSLLRFQTTYEELKPVYIDSLSARLEFASRLPMRNWNIGW